MGFEENVTSDSVSMANKGGSKNITPARIYFYEQVNVLEHYQYTSRNNDRKKMLWWYKS